MTGRCGSDSGVEAEMDGAGCEGVGERVSGWLTGGGREVLWCVRSDGGAARGREALGTVSGSGKKRN